MYNCKAVSYTALNSKLATFYSRDLYKHLWSQCKAKGKKTTTTKPSKQLFSSWTTGLSIAGMHLSNREVFLWRVATASSTPQYDSKGWHSFTLLYKTCLDDTTQRDLVMVLSNQVWQQQAPRHLGTDFRPRKGNSSECHLTASAVLLFPIKSVTCWTCLSIYTNSEQSHRWSSLNSSDFYLNYSVPF